MERKSIYTRKLGAAIAHGAKKPATETVHIISTKINKWAIVKDGSVDVIKAFPTKNGAILYAKKAAKTGSVNKIIIHDKNGTIDDTFTVSRL